MKKLMTATLFALGLTVAMPSMANDTTDFKANLQSTEQENSPNQFNLAVLYDDSQGTEQEYNSS